jgi:disulfide bond formation protein DsbB
MAVLMAAAALGGALISQYAFGLRPCELCLLQRYPYVAIIAIGLAGLALQRRWPRLRAPLGWLIVGLFLLDGGIAAYHVGVEQGWISGPDACSGTTTAQTIEELRAQIMGAALVSCKQAAFMFLGLSMAAWNLLYALAGTAYVAYVTKKCFKG